MKVFGYLRVSGKGQVDGDGPERQQDSINAFCAKFQLPAPVFFFEAGVSGTVEAMDRPQFSAMIDAKPDCIVVERLDRLARDLMVSEFLLAECRKLNIPVYAADQGALINMAASDIDPTRTLLRQILGAVAEWEKSALVLKLRKARDRKRALTGRCEGPLPYGMTPEESHYKQLMADARLSETSFSDIATWMNAMGHLHRGKPWTKAAVYQVLCPR
jgi:DNA invertase Pin-like site-specific DNA recombinase